VQAKVLSPETKLQGTHRGIAYRAHIDTDGYIRLASGDRYRKPDDAARIAVGITSIKTSQCPVEMGCVPGQQLAGGFAVRATIPGLAQLAERCFQNRPGRQIKAADRCCSPGLRGGVMKSGQHFDQSKPLPLGCLVPQVLASAVEIREHGDGMSTTKPGQGLPAGGGHRRDGELQTRPCEGYHGVHRGPQVRISRGRAGVTPATG
jgi:hypothetical protein